MRRKKTMNELRQEILTWRARHDDLQEAIAHDTGVNQGTISRILRGHFRRPSKALRAVCAYADISPITDKPLPPLELSLQELAQLAQSSPHHRRILRLLRLAKELSEESRG